MIGITYGIRPAAATPRAGPARSCSLLISGAAVSLIVFASSSAACENPMFRLPLFRIRAFTFGDALHASSRRSPAAA